MNGDGVVDVQDLVLVAGRLGISAENRADVNGDGTVNILDLVLVAGMANDLTDALPMFSNGEMMLHTTQVREWLEEAASARPSGTVDPKGNRIFGEPFGGADSGTDEAIAELPESVQSGDVDPVSARPRFACPNLNL